MHIRIHTHSQTNILMPAYIDIDACMHACMLVCAYVKVQGYVYASGSAYVYESTLMRERKNMTKGQL